VPKGFRLPNGFRPGGREVGGAAVEGTAVSPVLAFRARLALRDRPASLAPALAGPVDGAARGLAYRLRLSITRGAGSSLHAGPISGVTQGPARASDTSGTADTDVAGWPPHPVGALGRAATNPADRRLLVLPTSGVGHGRRQPKSVRTALLPCSEVGSDYSALGGRARERLVRVAARARPGDRAGARDTCSARRSRGPLRRRAVHPARLPRRRCRDLLASTTEVGMGSRRPTTISEGGDFTGRSSHDPRRRGVGN
jgi:hypothetical protein